MKGLGRKTRFQKKKHGYSGGGKSIVRKNKVGYANKGATEVGKEAQSYKEYVKTMFGGGDTKDEKDRPPNKKKFRKKRDRLFHEGKRDVDHGGEEAPPKTIRPDYKDFMDKDGVVDEWAYGKRLKFLNPHLYPKKKKKKKKK
tara:strand:- start:8 stop:433 length:426 start_codon:yes stop_codon:yes gene_type:complete